MSKAPPSRGAAPPWPQRPGRPPRSPPHSDGPGVRKTATCTLSSSTYRRRRKDPWPEVTVKPDVVVAEHVTAHSRFDCDSHGSRAAAAHDIVVHVLSTDPPHCFRDGSIVIFIVIVTTRAERSRP
ncbi:hypothetical protein J6590_004752 [Homalodisca vitripennis]|nr:hypothetical protein J6590_004752 [Homalodisca vitripennis]